jgi:NAD(P)-dependent dehydrogenase (short-subunit alcohol dehydrogenase family)
VVADINDGKVEETVSLIGEAGATASYRHADSSSLEENEALVAFAVAYGKLDIACNNAGIAPPSTPLAESSNPPAGRATRTPPAPVRRATNECPEHPAGPPRECTGTAPQRRGRSAVGVSVPRNTEIAGSVFVSDSTVKTHVGAILRKLALRDRIQTSCSPTNTGSPQGSTR